MLQKYKYLDSLAVHKLQSDIEIFIENIKDAEPMHTFDPDVHFPAALVTKAKRTTSKTIKGKKVVIKSKLLLLSKAFYDKYKKLGNAKQNVYNAFKTMNDIQGQFNGKTSRVCLSDLPTSVQNEAKRLFIYLYDNILDSYGVKKHYESFCNTQFNTWCPFCGMETLEDYSHIKEDYDHLLAKSIYPFASVNMMNLAPMGKKCNRTHKKKKDLLWDGVKRVKAVDPYKAHINITVDFSGTVLPKAIHRRGKWQLHVLPNREEVIRWNEVFNISDRIKKDYFTRGKRPDIDTWIMDFIRIHKSNSGDMTNIKSVRTALMEYGKTFDEDRFKEGRYVRSSLFKWISVNGSISFIEAIKSYIQSS